MTSVAKFPLPVFMIGIILYFCVQSLGGTSTYLTDIEISRANNFGTGENIPPTVDATLNSDELWYIGTTENINWHAIDPDGDDTSLTIDLWISHDGGCIWNRLPLDGGGFAQNLDNTGEYMWLVPDDGTVETGSTQIKVIASEPDGTPFGPLRGEGICDTLGLESPPPPLVLMTEPTPAQVCIVGGTCSITWTIVWLDDPARDEIRTDIYFSSDDGASWVQIAPDNPCEGTYGWQVPAQFQNGDSGLIKIEATIPMGLTGESITEINFADL